VNLPLIAAIVAGLAGALGAYLAALRKLSGTVKHSEAETLWTAMSALTDDLTERNKYLRERLDVCEKRVDALETRIDVLGEANTKLREENMELRRQVGAV
jgi:molybdopterin converting factor small subunit